MSVSNGEPPSSPRRARSGFSFFARIKPHKDTHPAGHRMPDFRRSGSYRIGLEQAPPSPPSSPPIPQYSGETLHRCVIRRDPFGVDVCPLEDEFVSASKIGRRKEVGKGASATVKVMQRKRCKKGESTTIFAVKEFRKKASMETEEEYIDIAKFEFAIAKSLNHPNIVQTVQMCISKGRLNQVMEYCQQGDLLSLVRRRHLKTGDRLCLFKQVLRGVSFMHDHGIAHRDIKLENILMTNDGCVKIADFGFSEVFRDNHPDNGSSQGRGGQAMREPRKLLPGVCGTGPYIAPEIMAEDREYDPSKSDVWACGILFFELFLSASPWQRATKDNLDYAVFAMGWTMFTRRFGTITIDENCHPHCGPIFDALPSDSMRRCSLKMLHPDPDRRCTIKDALNDRWVRTIECCSREGAEPVPGIIDVSKTGCKMKVQPRHDHLPPPIKRLPRCSFDLGDGTSRYD